MTWTHAGRHWERAATGVDGELAESEPAWADSELEDELCGRLRIRLAQLDDGPVEDHVGPNALAEAVIAAAATAIGAALDQPEQSAPDPMPGRHRGGF